jgi:hypothetical protein
MVADLAALRTKAGAAATELYEIVAALAIGTDPEPYRVAGATWWLAIRDGPIAHP